MLGFFRGPNQELLSKYSIHCESTRTLLANPQGVVVDKGLKLNEVEDMEGTIEFILTNYVKA